MTICLTLFVVGAVLVPSAIGLLHRCPPSHDGTFRDFFNHCSCAKSNRYSSVSVTCQDIASDEALTQVLLKLRNYTIDSLILKRSGPIILSSTPFRKLNIHKLSFESVNFISIPVFRAFVGLKHTLEELNFLTCTVRLWSWEQGCNFVNLNTVRFESTRLPEMLTNELMFKYFSKKIRKLKIIGCSVRNLGNNAFCRFHDVEQLELSRNGITRIQRSMFPPIARRLKYLSLSFNPLTSIPDDAFVNMMRLEFLALSGTRLTALRRETFLPVWEQLEEIYFNSIELNCNCDSKWMLDVPGYKTFRAPYCTSHRKSFDKLSYSERIGLCERRG